MCLRPMPSPHLVRPGPLLQYQVSFFCFSKRGWRGDGKWDKLTWMCCESLSTRDSEALESLGAARGGAEAAGAGAGSGVDAAGDVTEPVSA